MKMVIAMTAKMSELALALCRQGACFLSLPPLSLSLFSPRMALSFPAFLLPLPPER